MDSAEKDVGKPVDHTGQADSDEQRGEKATLSRWQRTLLPLMVGAVIVFAAAFFVLSIWEFSRMRSFAREGTGANMRAPVFERLGVLSPQLTPEQRLREGLLILEANALERRHHQGSVLLTARIWQKHMAFIMGMILTLLGSIFVLGRLRGPTSTVAGGSSSWRLEVTSASPGIILSVLGTALLVISMFADAKVETTDASVYLPAQLIPHPSAEATRMDDKAEILRPDEFGSIGATANPVGQGRMPEHSGDLNPKPLQAPK